MSASFTVITSASSMVLHSCLFNEKINVKTKVLVEDLLFLTLIEESVW